MTTATLEPEQRPAGGDAGGVDGSRLAAVVGEWRRGLPESVRNRGLAAGLAPYLDLMHHDLGRLPRIVVMGEVNSGKTSLINALARSNALEVSVIANTAAPALVHDADLPRELPLVVGRGGRAAAGGSALAVRRLDLPATPARSPVLRAGCLIDTPGLDGAAAQEAGGQLPGRLADIVVWCSVAAQCWKESERQAFGALPLRLRRRSILVLTGADLLDAQNRDRVARRLAVEAAAEFAAVRFIATPLAQRAIALGTDSADGARQLAASGVPELEAALLGLAADVSAARWQLAGRWARRILSRIADARDDLDGTRGRMLQPLDWLESMRRLAIDVQRGRVTAEAALARTASALDALHDGTAAALRQGRRPGVAEALGAIAGNAKTEASAILRTPQRASASRRLVRLTRNVFEDVCRLFSACEAEARHLIELERRVGRLMTRAR